MSSIGIVVAADQIITAVLGMRAYAMCARSRIVLYILLPIGIAIPALDIMRKIFAFILPFA